MFPIPFLPHVSPWAECAQQLLALDKLDGILRDATPAPNWLGPQVHPLPLQTILKLEGGVSTWSSRMDEGPCGPNQPQYSFQPCLSSFIPPEWEGGRVQNLTDLRCCLGVGVKKRHFLGGGPGNDERLSQPSTPLLGLRPQPATCVSRMSRIACLSIFVPWSVGLGLGSACPWLTGPSTACSHVGCWALGTLTVKGQQSP